MRGGKISFSMETTSAGVSFFRLRADRTSRFELGASGSPEIRTGARKETRVNESIGPKSALQSARSRCLDAIYQSAKAALRQIVHCTFCILPGPLQTIRPGYYPVASTRIVFGVLSLRSFLLDWSNAAVSWQADKSRWPPLCICASQLRLLGLQGEISLWIRDF